jgi:hypothetical protein
MLKDLTEFENERITDLLRKVINLSDEIQTVQDIFLKNGRREYRIKECDVITQEEMEEFLKGTPEEYTPIPPKYDSDNNVINNMKKDIQRLSNILDALLRCDDIKRDLKRNRESFTEEEKKFIDAELEKLERDLA